MAFRFQFGIPPRTAAARSLLGLQRGDPDVVTPGDTTNQGEYGNVTGFGQRDPGNDVTGEYDFFLDETTISYVRAYSNYPAKLNSTDEEATLVAKIQGPIKEDEDGNPVFQGIKITCRPLACQIDHVYTADALNGDGLPDQLYAFYGSSTDYATNEAEAQSAFSEYSPAKSVEATYYWRSTDVPSGHTPAWTPPEFWEYEFTCYPHREAEAEYDWQKWETWDMRYRIPSWYRTDAGVAANGFDGQLYWKYDSYQYPARSESTYNPYLGTRIVPVCKGFYIEGGADEVPKAYYVDDPDPQIAWESFINAYQTIITDPLATYWEYVRKLYSYSYAVSALNSQGTLWCDSFIVRESSYDSYSVNNDWNTYVVERQNQENDFKAVATWTLEIDAPLCCWSKGYTIRGRVYFKKYQIDTGVEAISSGLITALEVSGSAINQATSVWPGMAFRLEQTDGVTDPPEDAGYLDWEVVIDETTAKGSPHKFLNFLCYETTMVDGEPVTNPPLDEMVYVSDFVVTEIVPPS